MLKVLKKVSLFCVIVTMVVGLVGQNVQAEIQGPDVCAEGYCVLDWETGEVIISKNKDEKKYPASITKVLTALVVVENVENLDETMTFSKYATDSLSIRSTTLNPKAQNGETMTVRQALYGMLLVSANECATALAEHVAGSEKAFADMMTAKAKAIGAVNSHFVNAHGLHDEEHYTTPYDIALIFSEALRNKTISQILKTVTYTIPATNKSGERTLGMGHSMVNGDEDHQYEGVFAGKTGRTEQAGRTSLTACERDGHTLISSLMKSIDDKFYNDQKIIFDYAFGQVDGTMPTPFKWVEKEETIWATGNVTIREFPSTYATSVGILEKGNSLTRLGTYGKWSMVQCESGVYYIGSAYLTTEDPSFGSASGTTEEVTTEESTMEETIESSSVSESTSEQGEEISTEENPTNTPSDDEPNEVISFLKKYWIYILDGVVVFILLIYCIVKLRNKSKNRNRINRNNYRRRRNKW